MCNNAEVNVRQTRKVIGHTLCSLVILVITDANLQILHVNDSH